eukprot:s1020_g11.t1
MLEDLKAACKGKPQLPDQVPSALTSFQQMEHADTQIWRNAGLSKTYNYLRRNKKLRIPVEWQAVLPARLHEATDVEIAESMGKKAVQPHSSGTQPPVATPVRSDAVVPQVEQKTGDGTSADTPMTDGALVPQVDAKVPGETPQASIAKADPEREGSPAEGRDRDALKEVTRKAIATTEPKFELGDKFKGLEACSARQLAEKEKADSIGPNVESKFGQVLQSGCSGIEDQEPSYLQSQKKFFDKTVEDSEKPQKKKDKKEKKEKPESVKNPPKSKSKKEKKKRPEN